MNANSFSGITHEMWCMAAGRSTRCISQVGRAKQWHKTSMPNSSVTLLPSHEISRCVEWSHSMSFSSGTQEEKRRPSKICQHENNLFLHIRGDVVSIPLEMDAESSAFWFIISRRISFLLSVKNCLMNAFGIDGFTYDARVLVVQVK